jgi:hypothetical protein
MEVYFKPQSRHLNVKVRSYRTDQEVFYRLLIYTNDVDLYQKIKNWKEFYNFSHPYGAIKSKPPYKKIRCTLKSVYNCLLKVKAS